MFVFPRAICVGIVADCPGAEEDVAGSANLSLCLAQCLSLRKRKRCWRPRTLRLPSFMFAECIPLPSDSRPRDGPAT